MFTEDIKQQMATENQERCDFHPCDLVPRCPFSRFQSPPLNVVFSSSNFDPLRSRTPAHDVASSSMTTVADRDRLAANRNKNC